MLNPRPFTVGILIVTAAACGSLRTFATGGDLLGPRPDVITQDQILSSGHNDLYDLIRRVRPYWLAKGGEDTSENPGVIYVFYDGTRMGGLETLRTLPVSGIQYIRWFDGIQAATRWGLDHERGVIYVSTQPLVQQ